MSTQSKQAGIGHIIILFLIVFAAAVGFAGWKVVNMNTSASESSPISMSSEAPEKIETKEDLVEASRALDNAAGELDGGLNDSSLNADLNAML